jgi:hypothetical protein
MLVATLTGAEHASVAVGSAKLTDAKHLPGAVFVTIGAGQTINGASLSTTVTVPSAWLVAPFGSVTVNITGVVPRGYGPGGDCVIVSGSPSASDEPSSMEALALHVSSATAVTFFAFATGTAFGVVHAPKHAPDTVSE